MESNPALQYLREGKRLYYRLRYKESIKQFDLVLSFDLEPKDSILFETKVHKARALYKRRLFTEALELFLELESSDPLIGVYIPRCLFQLKKPQEAIQKMDSVLSVCKRAWPYYLAGYFYLETGDEELFDLAREYFRKALSIDPLIEEEVCNGCLLLAGKASGEHRYKKALRIIDVAFTSAGNHARFYPLKLCGLFMTEQWDKCLQSCRELLNLYEQFKPEHQKSANLHFLAGVIYSLTGDSWIKAEKSYKRGLEEDEKNTNIMLGLALLYGEKRNWATDQQAEGEYRLEANRYFLLAETEIDPLNAQKGHSLESMLMYLSTKVILHDQLGYKDAKSIREKSREIKKDLHEVGRSLLMLLYSKYPSVGNIEAEWKALLRINPSFKKIINSRSEKYIIQGIRKRWHTFNKEYSSEKEAISPTPNRGLKGNIFFYLGLLAFGKGLLSNDCSQELIGIASLLIDQQPPKKIKFGKGWIPNVDLKFGKPKGSEEAMATSSVVPELSDADILKRLESFKGIDVE